MLRPPGVRPAPASGYNPEAATDRTDQYGRLLRYIVRVSDRLNVNVHSFESELQARTSTADCETSTSLLERLASELRARKLVSRATTDSRRIGS